MKVNGDPIRITLSFVNQMVRLANRTKTLIDNKKECNSTANLAHIKSDGTNRILATIRRPPDKEKAAVCIAGKTAAFRQFKTAIELKTFYPNMVQKSSYYYLTEVCHG